MLKTNLKTKYQSQEWQCTPAITAPGAEAGNLPEFEVSLLHTASSRLVGGYIMRTHLKTKMKIIATKKICLLRAKMPTILNFTVLTLLSAQM